MAKTRLFRTYKVLSGKYKNQTFKVYYSDTQKKWEVDVDEKTIYHGQKGAYIKPNTNKGDSYCARSFDITDKNGSRVIADITSANFWSRLNWNCEGKTSVGKSKIKTPIGVFEIIR